MSPAGGGFNPAPFIANLIQDNIGVTAGRALMREAGMRMSNATFSRMYGQVREAIGGREQLQGLDYEAIPSGEQYSTWTAGQGGQYATFTTTFIRPTGSREVEPAFYFHITNEPHTPQEAIDAAAVFFADGDEINPVYGPREIIGAVVTSVNRTVAKGA